MKFNEPPNQATGSIARQIESLINEFSDQGKLGSTALPSGLSLFESCREQIIDLPRWWKDSPDWKNIEKWLRPQVTWYHQLRTETQPFGFARSVELGNGSYRVIEIIPSQIAKEFQTVVSFIDDLEQEPAIPDTEPTAFIVHIPRYRFYGIAPATIGSEFLISKVYPFFYEKLNVERQLDRDAMLSLLRRLPSSFGTQ